MTTSVLISASTKLNRLAHNHTHYTKQTDLSTDRYLTQNVMARTKLTARMSTGAPVRRHPPPPTLKQLEQAAARDAVFAAQHALHMVTDVQTAVDLAAAVAKQAVVDARQHLMLTKKALAALIEESDESD